MHPPLNSIPTLCRKSTIIFQHKGRSSCPHCGLNHIHTLHCKSMHSQFTSQRRRSSSNTNGKFSLTLRAQSHSHFTSQINASYIYPHVTIANHQCSLPTQTKKFMPPAAASIPFPLYVAKSTLTAFTLHVATSAFIFQRKWRSSCPHSGPHHIHTFMWQIDAQRIHTLRRKSTLIVIHTSRRNIGVHLPTQMKKFMPPLRA